MKTRREHFLEFCFKDDLAIISRMFWNYAEHVCGHDAPMWVKDELYEKWLNGPFNYDEWNAASKVSSDKGSIPRWVFDSWSSKPLGCF